MKKNNKGSALQIVLVIFTIMLYAISFHTTKLQRIYTNYHLVDILMKQKNLEILLTKYYLDTIEQDILFSDSYENETYSIDYTVDVLESYYEIITTIDSKEFNYQFLIQVAFDNNDVIKFEYL